MIDAGRFATSFTAFWNIATPTCEHFVRKLNLNLYDRVDAPMANSHTENRAFVAEFGFSLFVETRWPTVSGASSQEREETAKASARRRIQLLQNQPEIPEHISAAQTAEAQDIALRLSSFFRETKSDIIYSPIFPGCGFIDHSQADIYYGSTLYEIKTVDRSFRSHDIRQLITYCALNILSKTLDIRNIGLFNPRRGVSFDLDVDLVAKEISGKSAGDLFEEIHQAVSGSGISR